MFFRSKNEKINTYILHHTKPNCDFYIISSCLLFNALGEEKALFIGRILFSLSFCIAMFYASMVMFFGLILAFFDRKIQKDERDSGGLKIIKLIAIYYFRFLVICCGTGLSLFCLSVAFFGIIIIASIILFVVIKRGIKV